MSLVNVEAGKGPIDMREVGTTVVNEDGAEVPSRNGADVPVLTLWEMVSGGGTLTEAHKQGTGAGPKRTTFQFSGLGGRSINNFLF